MFLFKIKNYYKINNWTEAAEKFEDMLAYGTNWRRPSIWDPDTAKHSEMVEKLEKLFGVAPAEAMLIVAEDRFFLEDQRGPWIRYMGSVDRTFARTEERKVKRLKREEYLRSKD